MSYLTFLPKTIAHKDMIFKILVMGLPGSGKTTLSDILSKELIKRDKTVLRLNADELRKKYHDWDFTIDGRLRQAQRMFNFCEWENGYSTVRTEDIAVVDFVAPIPRSRGIFSPDYTVWMNTIDFCRYEDTNKLFLDPIRWDYRIQEFDGLNKHIHNILTDLQSI